MASDGLPRLGGGVANAVQLRGVGSVNTISNANSDVSTLVSGINELVQTVGAYKIQAEEKRVQEDKIRAVSNAESEHIDATNAMLGGSYDNELNSQVDSWRSSGLTDSEIRLNIKDYKFNKAVKDIGLGVEGGKQADDVDLAFFDTFNKLELKAMSPILAEDRKMMQSKINNMNASYLRTGSDDLQTKLNNITIANKSYGMGEEEAMALTIQTAFDSARQGDEVLLKQLQDVKTSSGDNVLNTMTGSALYSKLQDNLLAKKEHDVIKQRQEAEFQQEVTATKLYTDMIGSKDIHSFKLGIDDALESGQISMRQHSSLQSYYKSITEGASNFPKNSDMKTYMNLYARAEQGTLTSDELIMYQSKLSSGDFEAIARRSIQQGGLNGLGNEASKNLNERVDNDSKAYSGLNFIDDVTSKLEDRQLADKRFSYIKQTLSTEKDNFIVINKRLPTNDEYEKIRTDVVNQAEKHITMKPLETKPTIIDKSSKVNGVEDLKAQYKSLKTNQDRELWYSSLTKQEKELLRNSR